MAKPMPRLPPVISATLSVNLSTLHSFVYDAAHPTRREIAATAQWD